MPARGEAVRGSVREIEPFVAPSEPESPASTMLVCFHWLLLSALNPPNRRVRTRTHGGVGGVASRDAPLSRSPSKSRRPCPAFCVPFSLHFKRLWLRPAVTV
jgi:hypothetical protein